VRRGFDHRRRQDGRRGGQFLQVQVDRLREEIDRIKRRSNCMTLDRHFLS
jgi:hypothetical protein